MGRVRRVDVGGEWFTTDGTGRAGRGKPRKGYLTPFFSRSLYE